MPVTDVIEIRILPTEHFSCPDFKVVTLDRKVYYIMMDKIKAQDMLSRCITPQAKNELTKFILESI